MANVPFRPLETTRLILRKWTKSDRELFHLINNDEEVMAFFPFRRTPEQSDAMMDDLNRLIDENGFSFAAMEEKAGGECIGMCGLHVLNLSDVFPTGTVEIGWRLAPRYIGHGYATEAGIRLLEYAFNTLKLKEVVSFAVDTNHRSTAVMRRIGMTARPHLDFDHPAVPDTHPRLKRHVVYTVERDDWLSQNS